MLASSFGSVEDSCFVKIGDCSGEEKDGDIEPIGRPSNCTVIGVEEDGDDDEPQKNSLGLDAPKIPPIAKGTAFHDCEQEHWPEKELHMLPSGFVYAGEGGDPSSASEPII